MVANIMKSFETIVTPTADTPIQPVSELAGMTLGEVVEFNSKKAAAPAKPVVDDATPAAPAAATPPAATPPAAAPKVVAKKKPMPETPPAVTAPAAPAAVEPPAVIAPDDATYIAGLTPEQKYEVEVAQFAEKHGHPGKLAATLKYFRDLDKLIESNPDITPESEDFRQFTEANSPKWNPTARKKLERDIILEEATAKVRQETQPAIQEQQRKLREMEMRPVVEAHVDQLVTKMSADDMKQDGITPIDPEVMDYIRENGYEKAAKKFKVEAPIVMGSINAERTWLGFSQGTLAYDHNNPTHTWLINFLQGEGQRMRQLPAKDRIVNGREFLPLQDYSLEFQKDPKAAQEKFYTFNDDMVRELLAANAILSVHNQIKELEEGGFKYERKTKKAAEPQIEPTPASTPSGSPGAGFRSMPGAAPIAAPQADPRSGFFEKLVPGGSKMAGIA